MGISIFVAPSVLRETIEPSLTHHPLRGWGSLFIMKHKGIHFYQPKTYLHSYGYAQ
jgi:hypothetical protein